jgi:hypothetical protein
VFRKIEEVVNFILLYSEQSVDVNRIVKVNVKEESIYSLLDQVFEGPNNYYEIYDRQTLS